MKLDNSFLIDDFKWSHSRINSYEICPKMFYLKHILCLEDSPSAFTQWGLLIHSLLERYFKCELEIFELSSKYDEEYGTKVSLQFPSSFIELNTRYYELGKDYFDNFEGLFDGCKILGIEEDVEIKLGKYNFVGFIDLIVKKDDDIYIVDHKSKNKFKSKKEKEEALRQLYLYSLYIYKKYNKYPSGLIFNLVRGFPETKSPKRKSKIVEDEIVTQNQGKCGLIIKEPFNIDKMEEAKKWALDTIEKIYQDQAFEKTPPSIFFCDNICGQRKNCPYSGKYVE